MAIDIIRVGSKDMLFSHRKGLKSFRETLQTDTVDDELIAGLWSCFHVGYIQNYRTFSGSLSDSNLENLFKQYWHNFFKIPIDKR